MKKVKLLACNMDWRKHGVSDTLESKGSNTRSSDSEVLSRSKSQENCHPLLNLLGNIKTEDCRNVLCAVVGCLVRCKV